MLTSTIDAIRTDKAKFARDVEYVKETSLDDILDSRVETAEMQYDRETVSELEEAAEMVKKLSDEEDVIQESAEVERILNATENITFNEMVGV